MVFFPVLYYGVIFCYLACLALWKNHGNWALPFLAIPCLLPALMLIINRRESREHNAGRLFELGSTGHRVFLLFRPGWFFVIICFILGAIETLSFLSTFKDSEYLNLLFLCLCPLAFAFFGKIFAEGLRDSEHTVVIFSSIFSFFYAIVFSLLGSLFSSESQSGYLSSTNSILDFLSDLNSTIAHSTNNFFVEMSLEWAGRILSFFGSFTQYFAICLSLALSFNFIRHQLTQEVEHYE